MVCVCFAVCLCVCVRDVQNVFACMLRDVCCDVVWLAFALLVCITVLSLCLVYL